MRTKLTIAVVAAFGALAAGSAGWASAAAPLPGTPFTSKVPHSRLFVGLETTPNGVIAYVCDGRRVGAWFKGRLKRGRVALKGRHGARLRARVTERVARGRFRVAGRTYRFRARRSTGPASVQQKRRVRRGKRQVVRWVVLSSGRFRGIVHELESDEPTGTAPPPVRAGVTHRYFGNHPTDDTMGGWARNAQGVADDDANFWFFANETLLIRYPVSFDLARDIDTDHPPTGVLAARMPPQLASLGYDHYGDLDYYRGFLFVPVSKIGGGIRPAIAVFRSNLQYVTHKVLSTGAQLSAGWLAVDPATGVLYSSNGVITDNTNHFDAGPLFQYTFTLSKLSAATPVLDLTLKARGPILRTANGVPVRHEHIQGGVFTPRGDFYLIIGINNEHTDPEGIILYDKDGKMLTRSCNGGPCAFNYEFHPGGVTQQEAEGITWWSLANEAAPGISSGTSLHAMMLDNDFPSTDDLFVKHYSVR